MAVLTRGEVLRRIVDRTDLDQFTDRVVDSFWDRPEFQRAIGLNPYQRRAVQQGMRAYRVGELRRALIRLADIDVAIKTGTGDGRTMLEEWLVRVVVRRGGDRRATATPAPRRA